MARRTTLKDLNEYLTQNPSTIELDNIKSKEDFIKKSPSNIIDVKSKSYSKKTTLRSTDTPSKMAKELHKLAKENGKSFTELWLNILEEGAKQDPLLKNSSLFKTIRTINKTTFNVAIEGISQFLKSRK